MSRILGIIAIGRVDTDDNGDEYGHVRVVVEEEGGKLWLRLDGEPSVNGAETLEVEVVGDHWQSGEEVLVTVPLEVESP